MQALAGNCADEDGQLSLEDLMDEEDEEPEEEIEDEEPLDPMMFTLPMETQ